MPNEQSYITEKVKEYRQLLPMEKYDHPGVYRIMVNGEIVYVGKARNMADRIANHMYLIKEGVHTTEGTKFKYRELKHAMDNGYYISFDVLYTSSIVYTEDTRQEVDDDIGPKEAYFINYFMPKLNKQIPDLNDYHKYKNKNYESLNIA